MSPVRIAGINAANLFLSECSNPLTATVGDWDAQAFATDFPNAEHGDWDIYYDAFHDRVRAGRAEIRRQQCEAATSGIDLIALGAALATLFNVPGVRIEREGGGSVWLHGLGTSWEKRDEERRVSRAKQLDISFPMTPGPDGGRLHTPRGYLLDQPEGARGVYSAMRRLGLVA